MATPKTAPEIGSRFGKLVVIEHLGLQYSTTSRRSNVCVVTKCDCGARKKVKASRLRTGKVQSCGCLVEHKPERFKAGASVIKEQGRIILEKRRLIAEMKAAGYL